MKPADILLALASTVVGVFATELLLNQFANPNSRPVVHLPGFHHDNREWLHALYDLRARGVAAYPIVSAQVYGQFLAGQSNGAPLVPLAGLSRTPTTFCNELNDFIVFQSDRHGFRNDDRLWDQKPPVMLVGDSFAQGACVPDGATIAAELTRRGFPTIDVSYNSNGPLAELAALVEYGPLLKPATVLWLYYEGNDLTDLGRELEFETLRKYLEPGFRQNLAGRQPEIDRLIKAALDARPEIQKVDAAAREHWSFAGILGLRNIRALIAEAMNPPPRTPPATRELDDGVTTRPTEQRLSDLEIVLTRAKEVTADWGGKLIVAYLPATERYRFPELPEIAALRREQEEIGKIAASLDYPMIDLDRAFGPINAPRRLFPQANWPVHLTAEGYWIVTGHLASRLPDFVSPRR
jgi:hypothetical protein